MHRELPVDDGSIRPIKLAHIVVRTSRLEAMRDFYAKILGATRVGGTDMSASLTFDLEHHRMAFVAVPEPVAEPTAKVTRSFSDMLSGVEVDFGAEGFELRPGIEHIAFTYANFGELLAHYLKLKSDDVTPCFCVNHGLTTSLYYRDPDGNKVELQVDNMTMEQADEFTQSLAHHQNPVGIPFDPDDLVRMYESGAPISDLIANGWNKAALAQPAHQHAAE
ncbi:MAG TPA: VOC family protein [Caulobacteraceae bacterium]|nr:VOC family protein [Caulobacteraceae bacterium]